MQICTSITPNYWLKCPWFITASQKRKSKVFFRSYFYIYDTLIDFIYWYYLIIIINEPSTFKVRLHIQVSCSNNGLFSFWWSFSFSGNKQQKGCSASLCIFPPDTGKMDVTADLSKWWDKRRNVLLHNVKCAYLSTKAEKMSCTPDGSWYLLRCRALGHQTIINTTMLMLMLMMVWWPKHSLRIFCFFYSFLFVHLAPCQ